MRCKFFFLPCSINRKQHGLFWVFGIKLIQAPDISKLPKYHSPLWRLVIFWWTLKYHLWYLSQIPLETMLFPIQNLNWMKVWHHTWPCKESSPVSRRRLKPNASRRIYGRPLSLYMSLKCQNSTFIFYNHTQKCNFFCIIHYVWLLKLEENGKRQYLRRYNFHQIAT